MLDLLHHHAEPRGQRINARPQLDVHPQIESPGHLLLARARRLEGEASLLRRCRRRLLRRRRCRRRGVLATLLGLARLQALSSLLRFLRCLRLRGGQALQSGLRTREVLPRRRPEAPGIGEGGRQPIGVAAPLGLGELFHGRLLGSCPRGGSSYIVSQRLHRCLELSLSVAVASSSESAQGHLGSPQVALRDRRMHLCPRVAEAL
mmetsp:Transcript_16842/g.58771  ORF Transcript_16842/g.58771 Transcript_16842/m.58771 type:complete len:205 (+) Transcript_16842:408-1022(+)